MIGCLCGGLFEILLIGLSVFGSLFAIIADRIRTPR